MHLGAKIKDINIKKLYNEKCLEDKIMENFKTIKKFILGFDIFVIPLLIYQSIVGSFPIAEWIVIVLANIILFIFNKKYKNDYYE